jgi:hypothetical protein
MMNINLHIERLILDGLLIEANQGALVKAMLEAELTHLLEAQGLSVALQAGGAMPSLRAAAIELNELNNPEQVGSQIARAVYAGIGNPGVKK